MLENGIQNACYLYLIGRKEKVMRHIKTKQFPLTPQQPSATRLGHPEPTKLAA